MSLHKWNIPPLSEKSNADNGSLAALADCLYQYTGRYKYAVFTDTDELIVPYESHTLTKLLSSLKSQKFFANIEEKGIVKKIGSFSFINAFFPLEKSDDDE